MGSNEKTFARRASWALPVWAILLFLGTLTHQPDPQTEFAAFAEYVTSDIFLVSHLVNSILGAAIGSVGVIALALYLQDTRASSRALTGMAALVLSNTINSSVFGAAAYAQRGIGQAYLAGAQNAQEIYNLVYAAPLFLMAITGILLLIVGGIFTGAAISASGRFPRWAGWLFALATVGFALGNIFFYLIGSVSAGLLIIATLAVAWSAGRRRQAEEAFAPRAV